MSGTQVFLSYVEDTKPFVDEFREFFFSRDVELYCLDRDVAASEIERDVLADRIKAADVFIAFIGNDYETDCGHELIQCAALRKMGRFPRIVPLTLSQTGKSTWEKLKREQQLEGEDEAFFEAGSAKWVAPDVQKVLEIRNVVLKPVTPAKTAIDLKHMILLGHPRSTLAASARQASDQLAEAMRASGALMTSWPDDWCDPDRKAALEPGALFVQPVAAADAPGHVEEPGRTERYLRVALSDAAKPALDRARIMLWLPKGEQNEAFTRLAGNDAWPAFQAGSPSELSHLLARLLGRDRRGPVLTLEGVDEPGAEAADVRRKLPEEIFGCVRRYLPEENTYVEYPPAEFEMHFGDIAAQRPILVAHDLKASANVLMGRGDPRQEILAKFTDVQERADRILQAQGLQIDDVFWVACIANGRHGLPRSPHLPTFHLRRWVILELQHAGEKFVPEEQSRQRLDAALGAWAQAA